MIEMNERMKQKLVTVDGEDKISEMESVVEKIVGKTKLINGCIIYDKEGTLEESEINFERVLKFVGDWTGYEVSCNELRFNKMEVPIKQLVNFAKTLSIKLVQKYQGRKFVIIISLSDEGIDLRFHTNRENEKPWLEKDLDKYKTAILRLE